MATSFDGKEIYQTYPRFSGNDQCKQSIPGRFSPLTQPGYKVKLPTHFHHSDIILFDLCC